MKTKAFRGAAFAALLIIGALAASAVAGSGPLQVVSSSTTTTTTTTSTSATTTTTVSKKITICHHARSKSGNVKHVTIKISRSAWKGHQRHGDSIGACTTASAKKFHSAPAHVKKFHKKKK